MSLAKLEKVRGDNASSVLAAATLAATDPEARTDEFVGQYAVEIDQIYTELRQALKLDPHDESPAAWDRITAVLEKELDAVAGDSKSDTAVERVGTLGLLSPSAYRVVFQAQFLELFRDSLGVRPAHVERCVKSPDDFQHLMTEDADVEKDALSLFMRQVPAGARGEPCWMIVPTVRQGVTQVVQAAWWVYPSLVDLNKARYPIDVLEAFAEAFGVSITLGGKTSKFISSADIQTDMAHMVKIHRPSVEDDIFFSWSIRNRLKIDPKLFRLGCGYAIDLKKYRSALARKR